VRPGLNTPLEDTKYCTKSVSKIKEFLGQKIIWAAFFVIRSVPANVGSRKLDPTYRKNRQRFPLNVALRFSMKALSPSAKSGSAALCAKASASRWS